MRYVRFEAPAANRRGVRPGVFALANGLAASGAMTSDERAAWRAANDWFSARVTDPVTVDRELFVRHPAAASWFCADATHLLERIPVYLRILGAHGIPCVRHDSDDPGRIVYRDAAQILVVPPT